MSYVLEKPMRGQNTHGQGEREKIPLLPYNVGKKSVKDSGTTVGSRQYLIFKWSDDWGGQCLFSRGG